MQAIKFNHSRECSSYTTLFRPNDMHSLSFQLNFPLRDLRS